MNLRVERDALKATVAEYERLQNVNPEQVHIEAVELENLALKAVVERIRALTLPGSILETDDIHKPLGQIWKERILKVLDGAKP
jgi:hypothetical protein